jgi:hypothetical protein
MEPIITIGILSIQIEVKKDKREKMKEKLPGLPTNIRLGWKWLSVTNFPTYQDAELFTAIKLYGLRHMFTKRQRNGTNNYDWQFVHSNWVKKGEK